MLGDVTDRSVRVWVRHPDGLVDAVLAIDGREAARASIQPRADHDHVGVAVLTLDPPQPGSPFEVVVGGTVRWGRFAPAPSEPAGFTFAFGSCHQPFAEPFPDGRVERHGGAGIYRRMRELLVEREAAFALLLGDQVYSDAISRMSVRTVLSEDASLTDRDLLETYRHLYRGYFNERGFRELTEAVPTYLMWDDHDIFDGWGSLLETTDFDRRLYRAAEGAYREYQHLRVPGGDVDASAPYSYGFWHGDVGFFVPDLRGERDFTAGRILGEEGWARLDRFLAEATAREVATIFLGISVPVVHASPTLMRALERLPTSTGRDIRDRWDVPTFEGERTRLIERLFAWQADRPRRQVVILSGDVHVAAAFNVRPRRGPGRFAQWTSSALSTPGGIQHALGNRLVASLVRLGEHELRVWHRGLATGNNLGLVEVVPADGGGHDATFTVHQYDQRRDRLRVALTDHARVSRS